MTNDVAVIGGGHNGLIAATLLAQRGLKVVVLERADRPGGCLLTNEIVSGFRCPRLTHSAAIDESIVRMLDLERHGLKRLVPEAAACAPTMDERALVLWRDQRRAAEEIAAFSTKDAGQYSRFLASFTSISGLIRQLCESPPPSIDDPNAADLFALLKAGRGFRALGKPDAHRLLRWMPTPAADVIGEWFESEPLKATLAASGILGSFLGPSSAGSTAIMLLLGAAQGDPIATGSFAIGGPRTVADALAAGATAAGVQIRTGVEVAQIDIADETATGVTLTNGETIAARTTVSSVDPKRTLLGLVDPLHLEPDFIHRVQNIRARGTLAKVNYAVASLPRFAGLSGRDGVQQTAALSGRIRLARSMLSLERAFDAAKYGGVAEEPWVELTIPSVLDPSLAPAGQHVVSAYVQHVPNTFEDCDLVGDAATRVIDRYAPGFAATVLAREVITPLDLERTYGLTGGHIFHGDLALDQLFVARPLLGWARYATPIRGLYLCGSGTHPGAGVSGLSGALAARAVVRDLKG